MDLSYKLVMRLWAHLRVLLFLVVCIPGCVKYYDVAPTVFPQAAKVEYDRNLITHHVRHNTVYDQFTTLAVFDSLWFSDLMRKEFVAAYAAKRGLGAHAQDELLKRNLEENSHWFVVYVLADIRHRSNNTLSEPHAYWTLSLTLDDQPPIAADKPKEVELDPELENFFRPYANSFKMAYKVTFQLNTQQAECIRNKKYKKLVLTYSSPRNKVDINWAEKPHQKAGNDDFYWV